MRLHHLVKLSHDAVRGGGLLGRYSRILISKMLNRASANHGLSLVSHLSNQADTIKSGAIDKIGAVRGHYDLSVLGTQSLKHIGQMSGLGRMLIKLWLLDA